MHVLLQDAYWKHVAKATKNDPPKDAADWTAVTTKLTFDFLLDDSISDLSSLELSVYKRFYT